MVLWVTSDQLTWRFYLRTLLIGVGSISVWRGLWLLSDLIIFPDDLMVSSIVSIVLGLIVFVLANEVRL